MPIFFKQEKLAGSGSKAKTLPFLPTPSVKIKEKARNNFRNSQG
ncbi:MAG: hypothetical protein ACOX5S_00965 [Patescibacteria group bacterium]|jgi:hypothetical protein